MILDSEKKKFIKNLAVFSVFLILLDWSAGTLMKNLFFTQTSGKYFRMIQAIDKTEADIVIFGSSKALTQYDPQIISQKLGLSCYNAGVAGQGILFASAIQEMLLTRYQPKIIILNIEPELLTKTPNFYPRISELLPFYSNHKQLMQKYIRLKSRFEKFKLISKLYPYNSKILHIIKYHLKNQPDQNGYMPLQNQISNSQQTQLKEVEYYYNKYESSLDTNFASAFEKFLSNAKNNNSQVILVKSPDFLPLGSSNEILQYSASFRLIFKIVQSYNLRLFDFGDDSRFVFKNELFGDPGHLNRKGAELFSNALADSIKILIQNNFSYKFY